MSTNSRLVKLNFKPGINRESTEYAEEGSWYNGDKVRFRQGRPENLRGYAKRVATPFDGTARDIITWSDNDAYKFASFGTEKKLYEYNNNENIDITPIKEVSVGTNVLAVVTIDGTNNGFYTVAAETTIIVSVSAHGAATGDFVTFTSSTSIGGNQDLSGRTFNVSVINSNRFHFETTVAAQATQSKVGTATLKYLLPTGTNTAITNLGYGADVYNAGASVTGVRAWNQPASASNIITRNTQWSLDTFGEDIIACRRGSRIFKWDTTIESTPDRAVIISASPSVNNYILVSPNDRHVVAFGSTEFGTGTFNPMLVRWSDQNNFNNFTPSVSSTSGENILTDGTEIVGAVRSRNAVNIWTDNSIWLMTFTGPPFVFSFQQGGTNCGLIGPHAAVDFDGISIWMGKDNFYAFDGQVRNLDCTVRRYIFENFNRNAEDKVYAGINSEFKEIIWLYCSSEATEPDKYVIYNPLEKTWSFGTTTYTTYDDKDVFGNTITTDVSSYLIDNEPPQIFTANGQPQASFIESAAFDIEDGNEMMFMDRLIPDFTLNNGNLKFSIIAQNFPVNDAITKGPFTITPATKKVDLRARGRQAIILVSSEGTGGTEWRYGSLRLSLQEDGLR
tara:strand:- start:2602 stop:4455 length:1854 start_codon:yes stop_codon:yes gene_type:complete